MAPGITSMGPATGGESQLTAALTERITNGDAIDFEREALSVFAYQFARNVPYRRYCERRDRTPATVTHWRDIPAVSTTAFKVVDLVCGPPERVFQTSGTTRGATMRGRHGVPSLALYRAAALAHFATCVAPDGMRGPVMALAPAATDRPESSLAQMIEWIGAAYGHGSATWYVGPGGLDEQRLRQELAAAAAAGTPVYLIGITQAFENLFARWRSTGTTVRLPYGSRIIDTGGHKSVGNGTPARPLSRPGFVAACWRFLNVPGYHCINEYGMTELCSQLYDNVLRERVAGRLVPRYLIAPRWMRTVVVDPETLEESPRGSVGLLCHYDLANCGSVLAVQTEDLGVAVDEGIELRGRLRGAEPRGCALLLEQLASANADSDLSPSRTL